MKYYESMEMRILRFNEEDLVRTSGGGFQGDHNSFGDVNGGDGSVDLPSING